MFHFRCVSSTWIGVWTSWWRSSEWWIVSRLPITSSSCLPRRCWTPECSGRRVCQSLVSRRSPSGTWHFSCALLPAYHAASLACCLSLVTATVEQWHKKCFSADDFVISQCDFELSKTGQMIRTGTNQNYSSMSVGNQQDAPKPHVMTICRGFEHLNNSLNDK